jgi:hypothetical protein
MRNDSWIFIGPAHPQNLLTRGSFIHRLRSCKSVIFVVSPLASLLELTELGSELRGSEIESEESDEDVA